MTRKLRIKSDSGQFVVDWVGESLRANGDYWVYIKVPWEQWQEARFDSTEYTLMHTEDPDGQQAFMGYPHIIRVYRSQSDPTALFLDIRLETAPPRA